MGNRSKWRVPEFPIASPRKLLFDIHTGSRKKGQRKMWGLNGQQTNSGVFRGNLAQLWNEVMLKSEKKYRPAVKNGHSKKKKLKAGKVSSCLFVPWLQQKFPPALGFLIWFSSKIEMVNYVDVYYYKLLQHFCSILRPSHLPSLIPTIPNAQHKERQLDKTFVFFLSLQQQIGLKTQIVIASRSLWSIRPAIIQIKILYCVSTFEGTWKVQFGKILLNLFPKFLSSHCLVASQPLAS